VKREQFAMFSKHLDVSRNATHRQWDLATMELYGPLTGSHRWAVKSRHC